MHVSAQSVHVTTEGQCRQFVMPQDGVCAVGVSEVLLVTAANQDTTPSPTVKVKPGNTALQLIFPEIFYRHLETCC